jgi:hypothetical protein
MGNVVAAEAAADIGNVKVYVDRLNLRATGNVTDLGARINTRAYLAPGSDIAALMLLVHQTSVHNAITQAGLDADGPNAAMSAEALVRALLCVGEAPLTAPVTGAPAFVADFVKAGPRDSKGRSLRDLDLTTRLLKYRLSYLVYSDGFNGLPASMKALVGRRLTDILSGAETRPEFAMPPAERQALVEILNETRPGLLR